MRSGLSPHAEALLVLVSFVGFNNILPRGITSSVGDSTQPAAYRAGTLVCTTGKSRGKDAHTRLPDEGK